MSPPANSVHVADGIECRVGRPCRHLDVEAPVGRLRDAVDTEQRPVAPGQGTDRGRDVICADERESLAVLGQILGQGRGVVGEHEPGCVAGSLDAQGGEDRVGLVSDQRDRLIAVAGPCQHARDLAAVRRRGRRPELGDRHDRGLGECRRRDGAGGLWGCGRGLRARGRGRGWRAGRAERARRRGGHSGRDAGAGTEPELAPGHRDGDAEREQPRDDQYGQTVLGQAPHRGHSARGGETSHPGPEDKERPVRAGGRGVGRSDVGGPDRIRTGDLQRDRLACWAATPRVQLRPCGEGGA